MSKRDLKVLIELQDNFNTIQELKSVIETQNKRLDHVKNQILMREESLEGLLLKQKEIISALNKGENTLAAKEKSLKQAESHTLEVTSEKQVTALRKEIVQLSSEIEVLEEKILENLDVSEAIQKQIDETKEFLNNSQMTLEEINGEVQAEITKQNTLITDCLETKAQHIEVMTIQARDLFLATEKNFKEKNYFCSIDAERNCTRCGSNVDSETRETAEKQEQVMSCPSCRRLFVFR
jgi:predicted  nucleic acid-binding Zn-ribbon protein